MNAAGSDADSRLAGSAVLGVLLAVAVIVAGLMVGVVSAIATIHVFADPQTAACDAATGLAARCNDAEYDVAAQLEWGGTHILPLVLIVGMSPVVAVVLVGYWVRRRGRRRMLAGFVPGAAVGMVALGVIGTTLLYGIDVWQLVWPRQ